jgi:hypothetical protein
VYCQKIQYRKQYQLLFGYECGCFSDILQWTHSNFICNTFITDLKLYLNPCFQNIKIWASNVRPWVQILVLGEKKPGHLWLTPVILATQEAETRRITVQNQAWQIVPETLPWKNPSQKRAGGMTQGVGPEFKPQYGKKKKKLKYDLF